MFLFPQVKGERVNMVENGLPCNHGNRPPTISPNNLLVIKIILNVQRVWHSQFLLAIFIYIYIYIYIYIADGGTIIKGGWAGIPLTCITQRDL